MDLKIHHAYGHLRAVAVQAYWPELAMNAVTTTVSVMPAAELAREIAALRAHRQINKRLKNRHALDHHTLGAGTGCHTANSNVPQRELYRHQHLSRRTQAASNFSQPSPNLKSEG